MDLTRDYSPRDFTLLSYQAAVLPARMSVLRHEVGAATGATVLLSLIAFSIGGDARPMNALHSGDQGFCTILRALRKYDWP